MENMNKETQEEMNKLTFENVRGSLIAFRDGEGQYIGAIRGGKESKEQNGNERRRTGYEFYSFMKQLRDKYNQYDRKQEVLGYGLALGFAVLMVAMIAWGALT